MNSPLKRWSLLRDAAMVHGANAIMGLINATAVDNYSLELTGNTKIGDYLEMALGLEGGVGDNSGAIRGPYQFSRIAWKEVGEGDWETNAIDLMHSARACVRYYLLNERRFNRIYPGREYTNAIAYLYHNQGPSGAAYYLENRELRFKGQSIAARALFKTI